MMKLSGLIISNDPALRSELARVVSQIEDIHLVAPSIPLRATAEIEATVENKRPAFCFLDVSDIHAASQLTSRILSLSPNTYVIGVGPQGDTSTLVPAMRCGVRDYISRPLTVVEVRTALEVVPAHCQVKGEENLFPLFTFLPAKPGVGASTICANTATALAARPGSKVALLDLDLYSGSLDFLLNLSNGFTIRDVMEYAERLDLDIWERMVTKVGGMDVLRAGFPDPERQVSAARTATILGYARDHYSAVCVDLPGMGDRCSYEALRMSRNILLVTTPEVTSVYMAGRSLEALDRLGLGERVQVVLNRQDASAPLTRSNVEAALGRPILAALPNHYTLMQQALRRGQGVITQGPLGRAFQNLAFDLMGAPEKAKTPGILGFLDRFFPTEQRASQ
ncbi:MAG: hypothetical protein JNK87_30575 [Bryobacterales bacterium]|nr:hypothetical protein [Bryobacterales bacterium]